MTRSGIVGVASACALVATLAQPSTLSAQAGAAPKTQAPATDKKPADKPATKQTAPAEKPMGDMKMASSSSVPSLGSIHLPHKVTADGQALPAGTYTLRLSDAAVKPVPGQTPAETKWVEFVQGGSVKGKEIATVLTQADAKKIAKQGLPSAGAAKIETLKGNEYLRVWVNKGGTNYLIHLGNTDM